MSDFYKEVFVEENTVDSREYINLKREKRNSFLRKLIYTLIFSAGSVALSLLSLKIENSDTVYLALAFPLYICGILCGGQWGFIAGIAVPLIKCLIIPAFHLFPDTLLLCFETAVFCCLGGYLYKAMPKKLYFVEINVIISYLISKLAYGLIYYCIRLYIDNTMTSFFTIFKNSLLASIPGLIILLAGTPLLTFIFRKFDMMMND